MSDDSADFEEFTKQREAAAKAYVSGDDAPLDKLAARNLSATFFGPGGDFQTDAKTECGRWFRGTPTR